jgi:hypothetical protein
MVLAKSKGRDGDEFGVIWAPMNHSYSKLFERVLVFKQGVLVADGKPGELRESSQDYAALIGG